MQTTPYFREVQPFRQPGAWFLVLGLDLVVAYIVLTRAGTDDPMDAAVGILLAMAVTSIFALSRLETTISEDAVLVRLFPVQFAPRRVPLASVENYERIENGSQGRLPLLSGFTVEGDDAIRLEYDDGEELLVGTQRPEEFLGALDRATA